MLDKQIELEWEYFTDSICSDRHVAALKKKVSNELILLVFEASDSHYTMVASNFFFLKSKSVSYSREAVIVGQQNDQSSLSSREVLALQLKEGCKIIENDIRDQIDYILKKIS